MSYDALLWTCCFLVTGIIVLIYEFCVETRRLQRIVEHLESLNVGLTTELSICRGDLDEADAELKRLQGGRLLR